MKEKKQLKFELIKINELQETYSEAYSRKRFGFEIKYEIHLNFCIYSCLYQIIWGILFDYPLDQVHAYYCTNVLSSLIFIQ
jgi:hypothetical protein